MTSKTLDGFNTSCVELVSITYGYFCLTIVIIYCFIKIVALVLSVLYNRSSSYERIQSYELGDVRQTLRGPFDV